MVKGAQNIIKYVMRRRNRTCGQSIIQENDILYASIQ